MLSQRDESPEFIELQIADKTACVPFEEAVSNPNLRAQVVESALAEVDAWTQRFAAFFERIGEPTGCDVVEAIRRARTRIVEDEGLEGAIELDEEG